MSVLLSIAAGAKAVLVYFITVNSIPITPTMELPTANWENCQLDLRGIDGVNEMATEFLGRDPKDGVVQYIASCEIRK